jgi:predicted transposase/invertase (TIGR01784 family)
MRYNPRVGYIFWRLFGLEENKTLLKSFVNAALLPHKQLSEITLTYPDNNKCMQSGKFHMPEIKGIDKEGFHYGIEMEVADKVDYSKLMLNEWSKFFNKKSKKSNDSDLLRRKINIFVMNFDSFEREEKYHHVFDIFSQKSHQKNDGEALESEKRLELHFIELEKFSKGKKPNYGPQNKELDKWTNFLATAASYERNSLPELFKSDSDLNAAFEALEGLDLNKKEEKTYKNQLKLLRDGQKELKKTDYCKYWQSIFIRLTSRNFGYISSNFLSIINELNEDLLGDVEDTITESGAIDRLFESHVDDIMREGDDTDK